MKRIDLMMRRIKRKVRKTSRLNYRLKGVISTILRWIFVTVRFLGETRAYIGGRIAFRNGGTDGDGHEALRPHPQ